MKYPVLITPTEGQFYRNHNGNVYKCIKVIDAEHAVMERTFDRWTLTACRTRQFEEDATIEWDHSIDGYWPTAGQSE